MSNFKVNHYDDYHSIQPDNQYDQAIELGCFPVAGFNYCRYFGLHYTGQKPTVDEVMGALQDVFIGEFYNKRLENIGITEAQLRDAVAYQLQDEDEFAALGN